MRRKKWKLATIKGQGANTIGNKKQPTLLEIPPVRRATPDLRRQLTCGFMRGKRQHMHH
jgi:hypothetical protein